MHVARSRREDVEDWAKLRQALWPSSPVSEHRREAAGIVDNPDRTVAFLARDAGLAPIGFAEASLRHDYVNGCTSSPVAFLEGIYVHPDWRRRGVARLLCRAVEDWAVRAGCSELASDADLGNHGSHRMHEALGFQETERVVFYRKELPTR